jgi:hypothetical protein
MSVSWERHRLEDLVTTPITYGVVKPGDSDPSGVPLVRSTDIRGGRIAQSQLRTITHEVSEQYKRTLLRGGEVLISLVGNPGQVAIAPETLKGANIARQVGLIRTRERIDPRFLVAWLQSTEGAADLASLTYGSVQQVINLGHLKRLLVPLPPLDEQRRIADVLGALDDLIETNQALIGNLIQASRAIVLRHLSGPLEPLSSILDLRRGIGYRSADFSEVAGIPSISMGASSNSGLLKRAKIRLLDRDVPNRYLVEPYDIVMANVDLTWDFGILAWPVVVPEYLGSSVAITSDMYGLNLRTEHADLSIAVWAQLMDDPFRDWVASCAKGTTVASIAQKDVLQFEVRTGVAKAVRVAAREMLRLIWSLEEENSSLHQARNELLPLLMSGRVHVGDVAA